MLHPSLSETEAGIAREEEIPPDAAERARPQTGCGGRGTEGETRVLPQAPPGLCGRKPHCPQCFYGVLVIVFIKK